MPDRGPRAGARKRCKFEEERRNAARTEILTSFVCQNEMAWPNAGMEAAEMWSRMPEAHAESLDGEGRRGGLAPSLLTGKGGDAGGIVPLNFGGVMLTDTIRYSFGWGQCATEILGHCTKSGKPLPSHSTVSPP